MNHSQTLSGVVNPPLHYVVKGRIDPETNKPYTILFIENDPVQARKKALDYYISYINTLEENYLLSCEKHFGKAIYEFDTEREIITKYSRSAPVFRDVKQFAEGINLYMVVNKPISYMDKTDEANGEYLIYGIDNDKMLVEKMIEGLIREYGYYRYYKLKEDDLADVIDFTKYKADKKYRFQNDKHTILEVPFDWSNSFYLKETRRCSESDDRWERIQKKKSEISKLYLPIFIESGSLMKNAFITKITSKQIRKNVASLLNTSGGYLFCGIDENRKAQPILTHKDVIQFRNVGRTLLEAMFGELAKLVSIHFYRYDLQYIMVFKVESSLDKPVFIDVKKKKVFFIRDKKGLSQIKDVEKIVSYCLSAVNMSEVVKFL